MELLDCGMKVHCVGVDDQDLAFDFSLLTIGLRNLILGTSTRLLKDVQLFLEFRLFMLDLLGVVLQHRFLSLLHEHVLSQVLVPVGFGSFLLLDTTEFSLQGDVELSLFLESVFHDFEFLITVLDVHKALLPLDKDFVLGDDDLVHL